MQPPSLREYTRAEDRLRESLFLRSHGLPYHSYPRCSEDLAIINAYINAHGLPPEGFFRRLIWRIRGGGA